MSRRDYIPKNDFLFLEWVRVLLAYALENFARWGVISPVDMLSSPMYDFEEKLERAHAPNSGVVDKVVKNEARKIIEKASRTYVQGFLARNPRVTLEDRATMKLTIYDTTPTNVPPPVTPVEGKLSFPATGLVEVREIHAAAEKLDKRAGYGVRIYYGIMNETPEGHKHYITERPKTGDDLPHSVFTRKKHHLFDLTGENGKEAFFCMRFENSKGQAGPWGTIISAFIP